MTTLEQRIEQYLRGSTPNIFEGRSEAVTDEDRRQEEKIDQQTRQESSDKPISYHANTW